MKCLYKTVFDFITQQKQQGCNFITFLSGFSGLTPPQKNVGPLRIHYSMHYMLGIFWYDAVSTVTDARLESLVNFYWITEFFSLQMSVLNLFKSRQETTAKKRKKSLAVDVNLNITSLVKALSFNLFNLSLFLCSVSPSCLCLCAIISVCLCMCL